MIDITNIDVPQYLSMLTEQYHISPEYLPVEITESVFAESNTIVKNTITRFHQKGFYVLMDDFGSGYSSLNVLKRRECRLSETRYEVHADRCKE